MPDLLTSLLFGLVTLGAAWLLFVAVLWLHRPSRELSGVVLRMAPDLARLTYRLARDGDTPVRYRVALAALGVYLVSPLDIVPDFLPGIGSLDDVIVAGIVLRWVGGGVGAVRIERHWSGSPEGLVLLHQMLGWR